MGCSGFSYKEWLGNFYPPKLPGTKMLLYYAERFSSVTPLVEALCTRMSDWMLVNPVRN